MKEHRRWHSRRDSPESITRTPGHLFHETSGNSSFQKDPQKKVKMSDFVLSNPMRNKMNAGQLAVGMIVRLIRGVEVVALAKTAGFDCLFLDMEHNVFSHETVSDICLSALLAGITPLVRVGEVNGPTINRALDCGATGIIVPHVESAEDAKKVVNAAKFTPIGHRSIMPCLPQLLFKDMPSKKAMEIVNEATMVILMVESLDALDRVEEIAAVKGVDMLLVGANDLANEMGFPGQLDHPSVTEAIKRVAAACRSAGIHFGVGGLGGRPDLAKEMIALGARYATAGADITFFSQAASAQAKKFG
jgi:2-keto-3-deoxy-L-rhamnonate aldolase RhmA